MSAVIELPAATVGLPGIALGGYLGGRAAAAVGPATAVTLRRPVPPGALLHSEPDGEGGLRLLHDGVLAATAAPGRPQVDPPRTPSLAEIANGAPAPGPHPAPSCFGCGIHRAEGDGLRIFPRTLRGGLLSGAVWRPHAAFAREAGVVAPEYVWAALDCPAFWALSMRPPADVSHVVTGRMTVELRGPVLAGEPHLVTGWVAARQGRRIVAGSSIYDAGGDLLALAEQTLVATTFGFPLFAMRRALGEAA
jgi:hypothetical protein